VDEIEQDMDDDEEEEEEEEEEKEGKEARAATEEEADTPRSNRQLHELPAVQLDGEDNDGTREAHHTSHVTQDSRSSTSDFDAALAQTLEGIHIHHEDPVPETSTRTDDRSTTTAPSGGDRSQTQSDAESGGMSFSSRPIAIPRPGSSLLSSSLANGISRNGSFISSTASATSAAAVGAMLAGEGPMTPRNEAGPFVLDGSGAGLLNLVNSEGTSASAPSRDQGQSNS
jgi:hypothetical protein